MNPTSEDCPSYEEIIDNAPEVSDVLGFGPVHLLVYDFNRM